MASGNDARIIVAKETTYGTRATPTRAIIVNGESIDYNYNRYFSPALGVGRWTRPSVVTTSVGSGSLNGDVPSTGFGYLLDGLHSNTVTPVQQSGTTAYLQTHTLDTAISKSFSIQVQTPPVTSSTLLAQDLTGVTMSGITFSWDPASVLKWEIPTVTQALSDTQSLATYTPPTSWTVFSFKGGSISIAGSPVADIVGGGNLAFAAPLRDDAFALGSGGLINKPVETDKPTATGTFTADFNGFTHLDRVINNTIADVVLEFDGATIASAFKYMLKFTIPDCVFTTQRPQVNDPGPVQQSVTFSSASSAGNPPVILYQSTDLAL